MCALFKVFLTIFSLTLLFVVFGCKSESSVDTRNVEGESCISASDCLDGLRCLRNVCTQASAVTDGDVSEGDSNDGDEELVTDGDAIDGDEEEASDSDEAEAEPECVAEEVQCIGNDVMQCNANKAWEFYRDCSAENKLCEDGECVDPPCAYECCDDDDCPERTFCDENICKTIPDGYCLSDLDCELYDICDQLPGYVTLSLGLCTKLCDLPGEMCPDGYECVDTPPDINYGRCVLIDSYCYSCSSDGECDSDQYCETVAPRTDGCCRPKCTAERGCPGGLTCREAGRCIVGDGHSDCPFACPMGYICNQTFRRCVLNCPDCGETTCCDANSAPNCYQCECSNPVLCGVTLPTCCSGYTCSAPVYGYVGYCI